jgi:hypothetical protein
MAPARRAVFGKGPFGAGAAEPAHAWVAGGRAVRVLRVTALPIHIVFPLGPLLGGLCGS